MASGDWYDYIGGEAEQNTENPVAAALAQCATASHNDDSTNHSEQLLTFARKSLDLRRSSASTSATAAPATASAGAAAAATSRDTVRDPDGPRPIAVSDFGAPPPSWILEQLAAASMEAPRAAPPTVAVAAPAASVAASPGGKSSRASRLEKLRRKSKVSHTTTASHDAGKSGPAPPSSHHDLQQQVVPPPPAGVTGIVAAAAKTTHKRRQSRMRRLSSLMFKKKGGHSVVGSRGAGESAAPAPATASSPANDGSEVVSWTTGRPLSGRVSMNPFASAQNLIPEEEDKYHRTHPEWPQEILEFEFDPSQELGLSLVDSSAGYITLDGPPRATSQLYSDDLRDGDVVLIIGGLNVASSSHKTVDDVVQQLRRMKRDFSSGRQCKLVIGRPTTQLEYRTFIGRSSHLMGNP